MKKIVLLRHSIADTTGSDHLLHPLSAEGIALAKKQAKDRFHNVAFGCVFASPLIRTEQTARSVAGLDENDSVFKLNELFYAATDEEHARIGEMYVQFKHAPLTTYYGHADCGDLQRFAKRAWQAFRKISIENDCKNTLVIGHGVFVPAMVDYFVGATSLQVKWGTSLPNKRNDLRAKVVQEIEGFQIEISESQVLIDYIDQPT